MPELIARPADMTPEWMTQALRDAGVLGDDRVTALDFEFIGTGKIGDNARFTLQYEGDASGAPETVVGKFAAEDETARTMAGAQGAYYNEVMFYRHLAGRTAMRMPVIYASAISDTRDEFILLMQDLKPAEPGSQLVGATQHQTRLVLAEAAKLAAAFYGDDSIADSDFVMSPTRNGGAALAQDYLQQCWPGFLQRFGESLTEEAIAFGSRYVNAHLHFATRHPGPRTLVHGDLRIENILFSGDQCWTVDWQTPQTGSPVTDFTYFLGSSVDLAQRRLWERDLLREYHSQLATLGVRLSFDECWAQYREQSMHGLLLTILGASFTSPAERSDQMFLT
ncbi:MAG TPA: phosphotransferase, partial [Spongiibacteraceae bacterium]|nr:phosphotransferase [Spongiibacteraceae bacterium]